MPFLDPGILLHAIPVEEQVAESNHMSVSRRIDPREGLQHLIGEVISCIVCQGQVVRLSQDLDKR